MIKPTRPDRDIAFGGHPIIAGPVAAIQARLVSPARHKVCPIESGPTSLARNSSFIADPAHVGPGIAEEASIRLQLANQLPGRGPVIISFTIDAPRFSRAAVKAVAAVSSVKENFENRTVGHYALLQVMGIPKSVGPRALTRKPGSLPDRKLPGSGKTRA